MTKTIERTDCDVGTTARIELTSGKKIVEWRDSAGFYWYSVENGNGIGADVSNVDLANELDPSEIAELSAMLEGEEE